jgi:basic amino acid/polyamine antiporter, APA family
MSGFPKLHPRADERQAQYLRQLMPTPSAPPPGAPVVSSSSPLKTPTELPRQLGLFSAIAVLVGSTIGSGIFRSPAGIADKLPGRPRC